VRADAHDARISPVGKYAKGVRDPISEARTEASTDTGDRVDTVTGVPHSAPPKTTRHGHLHAVGSARPLPVVVDAPPPASGSEPASGAGLASMFAATLATPDAAPVVVSRKLDRGRLCSAELVDAAGFDAHTALAATLGCPGVVRLRRAPSPVTGPGVEAPPVAGTSTVHTDARRSIVVPLGLRTHLGISANDTVIDRVVDADTVEVANPAVLTVAFDLLNQLSTLDSAPHHTNSGDGHVATR